VKSWKRERFAVVGFVPEGSGGLLKLRLARREDDALVYVGRVGTGQPGISLQLGACSSPACCLLSDKKTF
jgi:hypothetical protein